MRIAAPLASTLWLFALATPGCTGAPAEGAIHAEGDTPIRYVICGVGETNCFVAARFNNLDACESHKSMSEMLCDTKSDPGKITCTKDTGTTVAVAYCTK